jgi:hypothetical protein
MSDIHDAGFLGQIAAPPNQPLNKKMSTKTELLIAVLGWVMTFGLIAAIIAKAVK